MHQLSIKASPQNSSLKANTDSTKVTTQCSPNARRCRPKTVHKQRALTNTKLYTIEEDGATIFNQLELLSNNNMAPKNINNKDKSSEYINIEDIKSMNSGECQLSDSKLSQKGIRNCVML